MTATTKTQRGRPSFADTKTASYESPLYKLLQNKLTQFVERDRLNVRSLAQALNVTPATVYRWLQLNRITPFGAERLIEVSDGKLTLADIADYLVS